MMDMSMVYGHLCAKLVAPMNDQCSDLSYQILIFSLMWASIWMYRFTAGDQQWHILFQEVFCQPDVGQGWRMIKAKVFSLLASIEQLATCNNWVAVLWSCYCCRF